MNNIILLLKAFSTWFYYITIYGLITIPTLALIILITYNLKTRYKPN